MGRPVPKKKRYQNPEHLAHVHNNRRCVACGRPKPRGHHLRSKGAGGGDHQVLELCSFPDYEGDTCHNEIHTIGRKAFEKKHNLNTLALAFDCWASSEHNEVGIWDELEDNLR